MSSKHTPGPWKAERGDLYHDDPNRWSVVTASKPHYFICTVENGAPGDCLETEEANARLIAAAPELLAACEAALKTLDWMDSIFQKNDFAVPQREQLRAVIAIAKGAANDS